MGNHKHHIDDALHKNLSGIAYMPSDSAWLKINQYIEHTQHPVDFGLNTQLANLEAEPNRTVQNQLLNDHRIDTHIIDQSLYDRLSTFEVLPGVDIPDIRHKTSKKRFIYLGIIGLAALAILSIISNQLSKSTSADQSLHISNKENSYLKEDKFETPQKDLKDAKKKNFESPNQTLNQINKEQVTGISELSYSSANNKRMEPESIISVQQTTETYHTEDNELYASQLRLKSFNNFILNYRADQTPRIGNKLRIPKVRRLPFQIGLWTGFYFENRIDETMDADYVHKDGLSLLEQGNARVKTGRSFQIDFSYNIGQKFCLSLGIQQSKAVANTQINYLYTDIPVYDSTGKISGYIIRPAQSSPRISQDVRSEINNWEMPVSLKMRLFKVRTIQVMGGLGSNLQLSTHGTYAGVNFRNSSVIQQSFSKGFRVTPNASLTFRMPINQLFSLCLDYRASYRTMLTAENDKHIRGRELTSSIQFGLIYQPIIKR